MSRALADLRAPAALLALAGRSRGRSRCADSLATLTGMRALGLADLLAPGVAISRAISTMRAPTVSRALAGLRALGLADLLAPGGAILRTLSTLPALAALRTLAGSLARRKSSLSSWEGMARHRTAGAGSGSSRTNGRIMGCGQGGHDLTPDACLPSANEGIVAGGVRSVAVRQIAPPEKNVSRRQRVFDNPGACPSMKCRSRKSAAALGGQDAIASQPSKRPQLRERIAGGRPLASSQGNLRGRRPLDHPQGQKQSDTHCLRHQLSERNH